MIMSRARKLEWLLLDNFPRTDNGELDWAIFEQGPPRYLVECLAALEKQGKADTPAPAARAACHGLADMGKDPNMPPRPKQ